MRKKSMSAVIKADSILVVAFNIFANTVFASQHARESASAEPSRAHPERDTHPRNAKMIAMMASTVSSWNTS
jgi:hypothetical protein